MSRCEMNKSTNTSTDFNKLCPESEKTQKAREKLKARFDKLSAKITKEALLQAIESIHDRIARLSHLRVHVKKTLIGRLFDANKTSAPSSIKVQNLAKTIPTANINIKEALNNPNDLKGRVEIS